MLPRRVMLGLIRIPSDDSLVHSRMDDVIASVKKTLIIATNSGTMFDRFFFSSRGRHTSFKCDWSSDVCSSDLDVGEGRAHASLGRPGVGPGWVELRHHGGGGVLRRLQRRPQPGAAGAHDHTVELVV